MSSNWFRSDIPSTPARIVIDDSKFAELAIKNPIVQRPKT